jgi:hypothetical protein
MVALIAYAVADGLIQGVWETADTNVELLVAQVDRSIEGRGYLVNASGIAASVLTTDYYIVDNSLAAKTVLTITATPNPFDADGFAVCQVSVTPFVECTLLVDGVPYALTDEDTTVELTSDVPHVFQITLSQMAPYRADPLTVEAT